MSRATFALYFKTAGVAPTAYLTEWHMRLAENEPFAKTACISATSDDHFRERIQQRVLAVSDGLSCLRLRSAAPLAVRS
jgi:hypothetical protein